MGAREEEIKEGREAGRKEEGLEGMEEGGWGRKRKRREQGSE